MSEPSPQPGDFEGNLRQLERIVDALEDGSATLEESLAHYEKGVDLLKQCLATLRTAEQRIQKLTGETADGLPLTEAFEHLATADAKGR